MSTATGNRSGRPDRRSDWMRQKHSQQPADAKLAAWADRTIEILERDRAPRHILVPTGGPDRARQLKNALYDAVHRYNRGRPDDQQISLSANPANPADGKCYAQEKCRCDANGCEPTPRGTHAVHARVWWKHEGRAHQGRKPAEDWDYHPGERRSRQRPTDPAPEVAGPEPGQRFGGSKRVPPDPAPAGPRLFGGPAATGKPPTGRSSDSPRQPPREQPQEGSLFDRVRRSLGG